MRVLGAMSGSSLDGLDLAIIQFDYTEVSAPPHWDFLRCSTVPYPADLVDQLRNAPSMSGYPLYLLDASFSQYIATAIASFLDDGSEAPSLIGWHGHTIFHDPDRGTSLQLGKGAKLSAVTGIDVVNDFRMMDLALGGQGAPLASLADLELLPRATFYVNLGGITNMSVRATDNIRAGDLSVCNQALNFASAKLGKPYDDRGAMASTGQCIHDLRDALNNLPYHQQDFPKSLDNNWVTGQVLPLLEPYLARPEDVLHTCVLHIVDQLEISVDKFSSPSNHGMLCTGGGAKNDFLIAEIKARLASKEIEVLLPPDELIDFKEALLMAYMAICFKRGRRNVLASVTGASQDSIGGCLHRGAKL